MYECNEIGHMLMNGIFFRWLQSFWHVHLHIRGEERDVKREEREREDIVLHVNYWGQLGGMVGRLS